MCVGEKEKGFCSVFLCEVEVNAPFDADVNCNCGFTVSVLEY